MSKAFLSFIAALGVGLAISVSGVAQAAASAPLSLQIGGFTFTPGGFLDFTTVYRTTDVGSGIGTAFASIPFSNPTAGRESELRESAQNSRFSLEGEGVYNGIDVLVNTEADFLGNGPSNQAVTSNSATLRMRVYFVDLRFHSGWEVLAGQDWSLLTANRFGLSPMTADVFYADNPDPDFQVGLTWARQPQFRLVYHANPHLAAGVSVENPEQYIGGSVGAPVVTLPGGTNGVYAAQVDNGASNFSDPGFAPDTIVKVAWDSSDNGTKGIHLEAAGLASQFRVFTPAAGTTAHAMGGGFSFNAMATVRPGLRLIGTDFIGDGGGRYLFGAAPDLIIRQNGTISPVKADGAVGGMEYQVTPRWMVNAYYGGWYIGRDYDASATAFTGGPSPVGYGFPGSANSNNKSIQEASLGVTETFWRSARAGALQLITQGAYLTRAPWSVASGQPKDAHTGMVYADLRYVLP